MKKRAEKLNTISGVILGGMFCLVGYSLLADGREVWGAIFALLGIMIAIRGAYLFIFGLIYALASSLLLFFLIWLPVWFTDETSFWSWAEDMGWLFGVFLFFGIFAWGLVLRELKKDGSLDDVT